MRRTSCNQTSIMHSLIKRYTPLSQEAPLTFKIYTKCYFYGHFTNVEEAQMSVDSVNS